MPTAIDESVLASAWRFIISKLPTVMTWNGAQYTGCKTDTDFGLDFEPGGYIQDSASNLILLRADFTSGIPEEGAIVVLDGLGYRVNKLKLVRSFGFILTLQGPDKK